MSCYNLNFERLIKNYKNEISYKMSISRMKIYISRNLNLFRVDHIFNAKLIFEEFWERITFRSVLIAFISFDNLAWIILWLEELMILSLTWIFEINSWKYLLSTCLKEIFADIKNFKTYCSIHSFVIEIWSWDIMLK